MALFYGATFSTWKNIVYNSIHNIGFLYDAIYFLVTHHMEAGDELATLDPSEHANWWYKLGIYYGTILYKLLYTAPADGALPSEIDPLADVLGVKPSWYEDLTKIPPVLVDADGNLIDEEGNLIDEDGNIIDAFNLTA